RKEAKPTRLDTKSRLGLQLRHVGADPRERIGTSPTTPHAGEPSRDQERNRQSHFRRNRNDAVEDEGDRAEDVRRHRRDADSGSPDRASQFWRLLIAQEAG